MRTMSSDYGSDLDSDVADVVDEITFSQQVPPSSAQVSPAHVPPKTPRPALRNRDANVPATPPSSNEKLVGEAQYALGSSQQQRCDATPPSSASGTAAAEPYRMPFGKHNGMTLAEIPEGYVWWLIRTPSSSRPIELTEALEAWKEEKMKPKVLPQAVSMPSQTQSAPSKMPVSRETHTPPSSQVCQAPPPSSQVAMMSAHLSKYIYSPSSSQPSVSPTPSIPYPCPSQPTNTQHSLNAPLYVLPFGDFKGKTLHEVPEDYLLYLGASEDKLASLPGLADALRSMKQGLPPFAVKPTVPNLPSSQALSPQIRASSQVPMASQS
jgi:uncharacterized protein (DUF3820 family)